MYLETLSLITLVTVNAIAALAWRLGLLPARGKADA